MNEVNNLEPYLNKVICGLANLKISSGIQTKLLTYMSYGIPSVCSQQVFESFDAIKESKINFYKNNEEMQTIKKFKWDKIILPTLNKILN